MVAYITELTNDNYKSFTDKGLVLVDIKAEWCGPCKTLSPIIDKISSDYFGKVSVGKLDADASKEIIAELGVRNIPTILLYKDGEIIERKTGMIMESKLKEMIDGHLVLG
jgi:thioredoxin 1